MRKETRRGFGERIPFQRSAPTPVNNFGSEILAAAASRVHTNSLNSPRQIAWAALAAFCISLMTCPFIWAQGTAQISGTVTDPSGAVLPGVEVTVTQTDTGVVRSALTN